MRKLWIPTLIVVLTLTARLVPGPRIIDDSYITYRYSRNILAGNGFVFNQSEPVLGTTTPLYTLILTTLALPLGGQSADFPRISWILNAIIDAVSCVLLFQLGKKLNAPLAGVVTAFVWTVAPFSVTFSIGGLETSLVVCLLLYCSICFLDGNTRYLFLFSSLLLLTRPDGLILVALLLGIHGLGIWKAGTLVKLINNLPYLFIPYGSWMIYAWVTFGSPIPHSIAAKAVAYQLPVNAALIRLIQHFATPFVDQMTISGFWLGLLFLVYLGLFVFAIHRLRMTQPLGIAILSYPILYVVIFSVANPLIFRWYLTPPTPFYIFGILYGAYQVLFVINKNMAMRIIASTIIMVYISFASIRSWQWIPDNGPTRPAPEMAYIGLETLYYDAAKYLSPRLQSNDVLAAGDVGVLGYYTSARILDTVGLNSPVSTQYYPLPKGDYVINYAIPIDLIIAEKPDFIVIPEVYGRNTLLRSDQFHDAYKLIHQLPSDIYGSKAIFIFEANDHVR